jgi:hypothetical protein
MLERLENHLENVRQRPEHKKRQYALVVSLVVTLIIFGVWLGIKLAPENQFVVKPIVPVKAITASVGDSFLYIKDLIFGKNKVQYASDNVEVVGGKN